jgi:hypothetical protein
MVTIDYGNYNRLGNLMFNRVAAYIFAKKHNYLIEAADTLPWFKNKPSDPEPVNTGFGENWCSIKVRKDSGTKKFTDPVVHVHNGNYLELLESDKIPDARYHFSDYFQIKEFIVKYEKEIRDYFIYNINPRPKNEIFVAFRLGDAEFSRARLPRDYYNDALTRLYNQGCKGGYITSENIDHPDVKYLSAKFSLKPYCNLIPLEKISFAKDFNNLVLSEGSFSFWIGFLSNAEKVFINDRRDVYAWHGDIFVNPKWTRLFYDSPHLPG